jgi:putative monooxygenase
MAIAVIHEHDITAKQDRGGAMRVLLSPRTVETTSGFMGTLILQPGESYGKHYHPYSDEYVYVISGQVAITDEETGRLINAGSAAFIPKNTQHSLHNTTTFACSLIFFSTPLAPRPELGHVMLEE